jgi:membrane protease YdiL (CAAX protease family)
MPVATNAKADSRLVESLRRNVFFRLGVIAACLMVWLVGFRGFAIPALKTFGDPGTLVGDGVRILGALVYVAGAIFLYQLLVQWMERRAAVELARRPGVAHGLAGFAIGTLLACTAIGLMWVVGAAHLTGFGDATRLIATFSAAIMASVAEELLFRGVLFRNLERAFGTFVALFVSALLFGLAHIVNPDSTLIGSLAIAIEAGLLLALAYVVTRNLWFPIGLHLAWNFTQGGIFGPASGKEPHGLVRMTFAGPDWLSGGASGAEASILAVALCVALASAFAVLAMRRGEWKPRKLNFTLG